MKKLMLTVFLVLGLLIMAAPALAAPFDVNHSINYSLSNSVGTPYGSGGLFTLIDVSTPLPHATIQTFCIELDENIYPTGNFVASISNFAVLGGRNTNSNDQISPATDWLYAQYHINPAAYNPAALQIAFWLLEDEMSQAEASNWVSQNYFTQALLDTANGYKTAAETGHTGTYGTQVLNLKDSAGNPRQSHLIYVPEPGILILLGIAMSAIGAASWRLRKL